MEFHFRYCRNFDLVQWSVPLGSPHHFLKIQGRAGGYFWVFESEHIQHRQCPAKTLTARLQTGSFQNLCSMVGLIDHHLL